MARIEKAVFISYRRVDRWPALAVFKDLTQHGYDVFVDYDGIASGDFEHAIVDNIRARAHFVLLLTPTALERCDEPADWLRREIETAFESRRNVVPLLLDGFSFESPLANERLTGSLELLRRYQALKVPDDYFDDAMTRLRNRFLAVAVETVLHPASRHARHVAERQRASALGVDPSRSSDELVGSRPGRGRLRFHFASDDLTQDDAAKVRRYRKTAEQGDPEGQTSLGWMYQQGLGGLPQDAVEAVRWYRKAAEQGFAAGQSNLGVMYASGRGGLPRDDVQAMMWFRKSADQDFPDAQANLGRMYELGRGGLPKDLVQALSLYRKAAAQGNAHARKALERLGSA